MGFGTDDVRIRDSYAIAQEPGLHFSFAPNEAENGYPPQHCGHSHGDGRPRDDGPRQSLGGGKVRIVRINDMPVEFSGEYNALIVVQQDKPGVVAHITSALSERGVNIAFMRLFRTGKGSTAYTIVESDQRLPDDIAGGTEGKFEYYRCYGRPALRGRETRWSSNQPKSC